jgi:hypothetical protein
MPGDSRILFYHRFFNHRLVVGQSCQNEIHLHSCSLPHILKVDDPKEKNWPKENVERHTSQEEQSWHGP